MALAAMSGLILLLGLSEAALAVGGNTHGETRAGRRARDAYVLTRGEHGMSTNLSIEEFLALRKSFPGEFLWARRGGKRFLIRDRAVLAEARALFDPLRTLDPEREALQARQRDLAREEAVLDREQQEIERAEEALENDHGDNARATREDLRRRQDDLRPRMRRLESKDWELEAIERSLEEREEALEKKAEEKLWQLIDATVARGLAEHLDRP
jgi:DNA repair exonuclease SbcCD ATPase subunit